MKKPNIVFVFADQLRYDALGSSGNSLVKTHNFDRLAAEGVVFDQCFSNCPVCSPYRGLLFSGKYPHVNGVVDNEYALRDDENTLPRVLSRAGYRTGFVGKLHLGYGPYTEEKRLGFDYMAAYNCGHDYYNLSYFENDGPETPFNKWAPEGETDLALGFIERHLEKTPEQPFALFLAWGPPHWPYNKFPKEFDKYSPDDVELSPNVPRPMESFAREEMAKYLGNVTALDHYMGVILAKLAELGLEEDTIVCFSSDHGDHLSSHGHGKPFDKLPDYFKRSSKMTPYEESIHVPLLVRYPRSVPAGRRTRTLAGAIDCMPTLLSLCGLETPAGVQGADLSPAARGEKCEGPDSVYLQIFGDAWPHRSRKFWREDGGAGRIGNRLVGYWRAVRTAKWLYARWHRDQYGPWLFDIKNDPAELTNLAADPAHAATRKELEARLARWMAETGDPFEAGPRDPETDMLQIGQKFTHDKWLTP